MFYVDSKTPEQAERWEAALAGLRALEEEARTSDDPWFFGYQDFSVETPLS